MKKYHRCTIRRTFVRGSIQIGLVTGNVTVLDNVIETAWCGETLWREERDRGVCARCARGHEDEHSKFANNAERARAIGGRALVAVEAPGQSPRPDDAAPPHPKACQQLEASTSSRRKPRPKRDGPAPTRMTAKQKTGMAALVKTGQLVRLPRDLVAHLNIAKNKQ